MARKLNRENGKLKRSLSVLGRNKTRPTRRKSKHNYSAKTWLLKLTKFITMFVNTSIKHNEEPKERKLMVKNKFRKYPTLSYL